jgi:hypothetical protein
MYPNGPGGLLQTVIEGVCGGTLSVIGQAGSTGALPVTGFGGAVEAQVGDGAQVEVVLNHIQRPCHLAEQQHPMPYAHHHTSILLHMSIEATTSAEFSSLSHRDHRSDWYWERLVAIEINIAIEPLVPASTMSACDSTSAVSTHALRFAITAIVPCVKISNACSSTGILADC